MKEGFFGVGWKEGREGWKETMRSMVKQILVHIDLNVLKVFPSVTSFSKIRFATVSCTSKPVIPPANETSAFSREGAGAYNYSSVHVFHRSLIDNKNIAFTTLKRKFSDLLDRPPKN